MGTLLIKEISKSFQGRKVLEKIQFQVEEGEFVTILGPSGSGKSTLFQLIGGLLKPRGRIDYYSRGRIDYYRWTGYDGKTWNH